MKNQNRNNDYVATIINGLKTPAIAQINALESLLKTCSNKISTDEKDLIMLTLNSCNYMQNLIDTINSINKLSNEHIKLNYEKFDIFELTKKVILGFDVLLKYCKLTVSFNHNQTLIINADKTQIKKVLENIFTNIIHYSEQNTVIYVEIVKNKTDTVFQIKNTSSYITNMVQNNIFNFESMNIKNISKNKSARDMGLYLSREIINAHFGKISIKNLNNNMNAVNFTIPN